MADFYWVGTYEEDVKGITAFDFNWPGNWLIGEPLPDCLPVGTGKNPNGANLTPTGAGGVGIAIPYTAQRGIRPDNYNQATILSSEELPSFTAVCNTYSLANRAPGPGDNVWIGLDYHMARTPLLFGGFQGGSTGGVWLNGAVDTETGGYTYASGTTYNSSLNTIYIGGMYSGHPDFNYPWARIGGGFASNSSKYEPYTQSPDFADKIWKSYFEESQTVTLHKGETVVFPDAVFNQHGLTWSAGDITGRVLSLNIKADNIIESVRSYAALDIIVDFNIVKNLKQWAEVVPGSEIKYYDAVNTVYTRLSHNTVSFISGTVREIYNKAADNLYDWGGNLFDDITYDTYYQMPTEKLILDGITAGYVNTYICDQIKVNSNTYIGSLHIDDKFTYTENKAYCKKPGTVHTVEGVISRTAVETDLGLTGTEAAVNLLDSKLYVRADFDSFMSGGPVDTGDGTVTNLDREDGYINLFMGSYGTGVTASTKFCDIDVDLKDDGDYTYFDGDLEYRPVRLLFTGDAPIVIDYLEAKTCKIGTHLLSNTNYVSVGSAKLGKAAWFDPFANGHSKWYFGTRDNVNYTTFLGGIEFQEEGVSDTYYDQFDDYKKLPHTSVLRLSPVMRLYNPSIGITTPAQLVFRRSGTQNEIINRTPNGG